MNTNAASTLFKQLIGLVSYDPCSSQVEVIAADLAARLGASKGVCVAVVKSRRLTSLSGVLEILRPYGAVVSYRCLEGRNARVVFLEIDKAEPESQWADATCRAVKVQAPRQLAGAWA